MCNVSQTLICLRSYEKNFVNFAYIVINIHAQVINNIITVVNIIGRLCGRCGENYGVTLDLQACTPSNECGAGLAVFIFLCKL